MNILTFDIEDWYCRDNISRDMQWDKFEVRIYDNTHRILDVLEEKKQKATFFCLGWLAEKHPAIIKEISIKGHQVGCHSYQHELSSRFDRKTFFEDTNKAKKCIEDTIGKEVDAFRAPAFSITEANLYTIEILSELGFHTDCSIFPASRDFGGMPEFGIAEPAYIEYNGILLKEFPINLKKIMNYNIIFSGGGYFRFMPYLMTKYFTQNSSYVMCYMHPSDFDPTQPYITHLPKLREWKNHVGLKKAFSKFKKYIADFEFLSICEADKLIDWKRAKIVKLK